MTWAGAAARGLLVALLAGLVACSHLERAAAKDPQRCERDPGCKGKQDKSKDCYTACVDDLACVDRCRQVTGQR